MHVVYRRERDAGNDQPDFATYRKDGMTGFEYANQRYYSAGLGRFLTVDSDGRSAEASNPASWNRYSYGFGDPVGNSDPTGLDCGDFNIVDTTTGKDLGNISDIIGSGGDLANFAITIFSEASESASQDAFPEMGAIAATVMNCFQIVNGYALIRATNYLTTPPRFAKIESWNRTHYKKQSFTSRIPVTAASIL